MSRRKNATIPEAEEPPVRRPTVLFAEDDVALRGIVEVLLDEAGFEVLAAADGAEALALFRGRLEDGSTPDAVLADINMPNMDGLELIDEVKVLDPHVPVVFVTAYSSVDSAITALRKGAFDYITKPFRNDHLVRTVRNAVQQRRLTTENASLRAAVRRAYGSEEVVGRSPGLLSVFSLVEKAAPTGASVLIYGETGTGKELVARAVHFGSRRAEGPFLSVNCAALPEGLLESELFGHEKGAFTGAVASSKGLFRAAEGGTLFLDEIGEMVPAVQAKLLRVLESREVRPVGGTASIRVDVRIVAATHCDLYAASQEGKFREDLFYRLAVIEVDVPPLRDRPEDISLLARHFLARLALERGEPERRLSPEVLERLRAYAWPGNVRELMNCLERAVIVGGETLAVEDLGPRVQDASVSAPASGATLTLLDREREHIREVLGQTGGDRKQAAQLLGIDLSTLYRKLKRWESESPSED
ncbi:MAG: sigma-54-dependent Fis family transcriptional regulator [Planctomycetes bacterium]|nr:sigma-54-dependent Fis family transcriptional regulator [Planctomycetota bacterium]